MRKTFFSFFKFILDREHCHEHKIYSQDILWVFLFYMSSCKRIFLFILKRIILMKKITDEKKPRKIQRLDFIKKKKISLREAEV